ncbi:MAG: S41 family peptidase, partial [Gemmatimonadota bacterium]
DSRHVAYTSSRNGSSDLYLYDLSTREERRLTSGDGLDLAPSWAPDDLRIAYVRDGSELRVLDVASGAEEVVARGLIGFGRTRVFGPPAWSPDGRWLAYMASPDGEFWNVHLVPADGSAEPRAASFLPNTFGGSIAWHPDGRSLFYTTSQRTEDTRVIRVDLVPRTPVFREDALDRLFRMPEDEPTGDGDPAVEPGETDEGEAAVEPVEVDFQGIRRRYEIVPIPFSVNEMAVSPDGETLVVSGSAAGRVNLFALDLDPLAEGSEGVRPLTTGPGAKGGLEFAEAADRVWYLQGGRVRSVGLDGQGDRTVDLTAEMEIDFQAEKDDVFLANWSTLDQGFYDPDHHGVDWDAVRSAWAPVVAGTRNRAEMRRALLLMTGELNASHTGVGGSEAPATPPVGRLGLRFHRRAYEDEGELVVSEVLGLGPAHVSGEIEVGDRLVSVEGEAVDRGTNLNRLLRGTVGERVRLGVASPGSDEVRTVAVSPISVRAEKDLVYRDWVESRREYVTEVSGGRLGYVHIPDMGAGTLQRLYLDLDQENRQREGIVVDVRNNNGGFVNAYALDVFSRRSFMTMQPRGGAEASSRHQLGQRAYLDPVILVTNQNTLSDGEDFTEGWRALEIGEVVGEPTAGWIIYTTNLSLFDGTTMRLPFIGVRGSDGEDMELNPRPVDVEVERPAGEWYSGRDAQLDAAVERLLARLDSGG